MKNEQMAAELEYFVSANWRNSYRDAAADLARYSGLDDAETAEIIALGERWDEDEQRCADRLVAIQGPCVDRPKGATR